MLDAIKVRAVLKELSALADEYDKKWERAKDTLTHENGLKAGWCDGLRHAIKSIETAL